MSESSSDIRRAPKRKIPKKLIAGAAAIALVGATAPTAVDIVQRDIAASHARSAANQASDNLQKARDNAYVSFGIALQNAKDPAAVTTYQKGSRAIINTDGTGHPLPSVIGYDLSPKAEAAIDTYGSVAKIDGQYIATPDVRYTKPTDGSLPEPFIPVNKLDNLAVFNEAVQEAREDALPGIGDRLEGGIAIAEINNTRANLNLQQAIQNQRHVNPF